MNRHNPNKKHKTIREKPQISEKQEQVQEKKEDKAELQIYCHYTKSGNYQKISTYDKTQKAYPLEHCEPRVVKYLWKMNGHGFDFYFSKWDLPSDSKEGEFLQHRSIFRKVLVKYTCRTCKHQNGQPKYWTSFAGQVEIRFKVEKVTHFLFHNREYESNEFTPRQVAQTMRFPKVVLWNMELYTLKCNYCHGWARPALYENQLEGLCWEFCRILERILLNQPPEERLSKRLQYGDAHLDGQSHRPQVCQANMQGQCLQIPPERKVAENVSQD